MMNFVSVFMELNGLRLIKKELRIDTKNLILGLILIILSLEYDLLTPILRMIVKGQLDVNDVCLMVRL